MPGFVKAYPIAACASLNIVPVQGYHVPGGSETLPRSSVSQDEARKKVNVKSFLEDFTQGAS
ncbi:MAG: hypothetical protein ACLP5H_18335, partial [Desulfomonilaceae bacterium]